MIISYDFDPKECVGIPILVERMVIALHKGLEGATDLLPFAISKERIINKDYSEKDMVSDLSIFKNILFFDYAPFSNTNLKLKQILGEFRIASYRIENARQVNMHNKLMRRAIGATLSADFHLTTKDFDDENILYFLPKSEYSQRTLYIIMPKYTKVTQIEENFIKLAKATYYKE